MNWKFLLILGSGALVMLLRTLVPGHGLSWPGTYEAAAHIWVGVMLALGFSKDAETRWIAWAVLFVATVFETGMFLSR